MKFHPLNFLSEQVLIPDSRIQFCYEILSVVNNRVVDLLQINMLKRYLKKIIPFDIIEMIGLEIKK